MKIIKIEFVKASSLGSFFPGVIWPIHNVPKYLFLLFLKKGKKIKIFVNQSKEK